MWPLPARHGGACGSKPLNRHGFLPARLCRASLLKNLTKAARVTTDQRATGAGLAKGGVAARPLPICHFGSQLILVTPPWQICQVLDAQAFSSGMPPWHGS